MSTSFDAAETQVSHERILTPPEFSLDDHVLRHAIESARDGISISDARQPDMPLVYVNPAFERMTGYAAAEIIGHNCRFLQGTDTDQTGIDRLRKALAEGHSCQTTLRNYRKDGVVFYNELSMSPVFDSAGELTHFIGIQKDVTRRVRAEKQLARRDEALRELNGRLETLARRDGLTGCLNRRSVDECLDREWRRALRDGNWLSVYMIDLDNFKLLNDRHGHATGDGCLQRVAKVLQHTFGRGSDFVGRYGGDEFVVISAGPDPETAAAQGRRMVALMRLAELPTPVERVTVSAGVATVCPSHAATVTQLMKAADAALYAAKSRGRDRLEVSGGRP